jgi:hypothetical protein
MAYLMHIGFDNSRRLIKRIYYFQYKGIRYKLIQHKSRKWCDVLLTIVRRENNEQAKNLAYITASEFLSALSWQNNSRVTIHNIGGCGIHENYQLRNARCSMYSYPRIPFQGHVIGCGINVIPEIETQDQRDALTLFREASSSNNDYLSFLFFWQILEVGKGDPVGWINKSWRKNRNKIRISKDEFSRLPLKGKNPGHYFYDDCRNAISHIHSRRSGKVKIALDTPIDNTRIAISSCVIKEFARFYIEDKLKLKKSMYLLRKYGKGFPTFVSEDDVKQFPSSIAYQTPPFGQLQLKPWH